MFLTNRRVPTLAFSAAILVLGLILVVINASGEDTATSTSMRPTSGIRFVDAVEEHPSESVQDWRTYADLVVLASVSAESPPKVDSGRGSDSSGVDLIGRTVNVMVKEVLWKSTDRPAPDQFNIEVFGWFVSDQGELSEAAARGAPRLEPGRSYVLALGWRGAMCSEGDETEPAHWSVIGTRGAVPADGGKVGIGEFEGSTLNADDLEGVDTGLGADSVLLTYSGMPPAAIAKGLDDAKADAPHPPRTSQNACGGE